MTMITNEIITLFNFLLPGFITSFLFYALTSFPKKSEFEAVVIALVYTVVINALVDLLGALLSAAGALVTLGEWNQTTKTLWSIALAVIIGMAWSYLYNNDKLHRILRRFKITNKTSYPSEWFGTFAESRDYVMLYLKDTRRIIGWPAIWPASSKQGHFVLRQARWIVIDDGKPDRVSSPAVDKIMIDVETVEMVEFLKSDKVKEGHEHEHACAPGADNPA